ncbi:hypothetical protein PWT90_05715 [Aphanocladium album]|nr:hypothetical protein PWT90_05715 [Aphanocladium album]
MSEPHHLPAEAAESVPAAAASVDGADDGSSSRPAPQSTAAQNESQNQNQDQDQDQPSRARRRHHHRRHNAGDLMLTAAAAAARQQEGENALGIIMEPPPRSPAAACEAAAAAAHRQPGTMAAHYDSFADEYWYRVHNQALRAQQEQRPPRETGEERVREARRAYTGLTNMLQRLRSNSPEEK